MKSNFFKVSGIFCFMFLSFSLTACKSVQKYDDTCIYVMIYDFENHAIKDVRINQGKETLALSDVYGRAVISPDLKKNTAIEFEKNGYEKVSVESGKERERVLYIKMGSASYFAELSEKNFDAGRYEEAMKDINKALEIEQRSDYEYLKNVIKEKSK